jgi:hypothetical protein
MNFSRRWSVELLLLSFNHTRLLYVYHDPPTPQYIEQALTTKFRSPRATVDVGASPNERRVSTNNVESFE